MKQTTTITTQADGRETIIQTDGVKKLIKSAGVVFVLDFSDVSSDSPKSPIGFEYSGVAIAMMQKKPE